ncbi:MULTISPECIES: MFS transporter [unclassified Arthrobacter]|uniref:MFS transporter n=1 Tax=unclassified Arthrobacter TaxID=235627 RepID=UPI001C866D1C|nr:glycoside-pentoside-hexuronide (GPH):cation symporter [Arthrobacter sp. MAHUQ-56]MBX7445932.1 glycoside-pentoside-hexuronide (GPH):cation symporter [Arthrobacter sp. MAHUQ-56]
MSIPLSKRQRETSPEHLLAAEARPGVVERLGFSLGDLASNLTWSTITSYLLFFYTDVAFIAAAAAGTLLLLARVLDAAIDPLIGVILDRTHTRFGRARPYLIFGAPVLAILTVLTFWTPGTGGPFDLVWAYITFILVGIAYSVVNVPYGSLMTMVTRDSASRMSIAGFRNAGATIGLLVISVGTAPLVGLLGQGNMRLGYILTVSIYAVVGMLLFWVVCFLVKERIPFESNARTQGSLKRSLRALLKNKYWVSIFFAALFQFARLGAITGGAIYYASNVLHNTQAVGLVLLAFAISGLLSSFVAPPFVKWLGHRRGIIISLVANVMFSLAMILFASNLWGFIAVFFVASLAGGIGFVALPALVSDSVEFQDLITGQRSEGLLYSGYSFATKVGTAIGGAMLAWGLSTIGYSPGETSTSVSTGVATIFIGLPIVLSLLQIICLAFYSLQQKLPEITGALNARGVAPVSEAGN